MRTNDPFYVNGEYEISLFQTTLRIQFAQDEWITSKSLLTDHVPFLTQAPPSVSFTCMSCKKAIVIFTGCLGVARIPYSEDQAIVHDVVGISTVDNPPRIGTGPLSGKGSV